MTRVATATEPTFNFATSSRRSIADANKLGSDDRAAHDWYRFVLSFPPHLVRDYLARFDASAEKRVLDPFCGTGTTIVECKKLGVPSVGVEANSMAHFASATKVNWDIDPHELEDSSRHIAAAAIGELEANGIIDDPAPVLLTEMPDRQRLRTLSPETQKLLLANSIVHCRYTKFLCCGTQFAPEQMRVVARTSCWRLLKHSSRRSVISNLVRK